MSKKKEGKINLIVNFRKVQKRVDPIIEEANKKLNEDHLKLNEIKSSYVVETNRLINEVDKLKAQIKKIRDEIKKVQDECNHDWRLIRKPALSASLVPGVFVGKKEPHGITPEMTLICTKCRKRLVASIRGTCPNCLSPMREIGLYTIEDDGTTSRKKYFGQDYLYYAIIIDHCTKCDFRVASDEWNQ